MPWLPQNIQKRVFRYVLNKLAVFSNLDLDNLDVTLGASSELALKDVQVDTERLNIPGLFVRDGRISKLNLKLGVGGVQIDGDGIDMTVALSSRTFGTDLNDDVAALLSKTTADIAQSIMPETVDSMENEETEEESGYGLGEFSNVVSRMVDAALSQLVVELRNITIRTIIDDDAVSEMVIEKCVMNTMEDVRHVKLHGLNFYSILPDQTTEYGDDDNSSQSGSDDDGENDQLMQSAVFSHEEASTMYMSAMENVTQPDIHELRVDLLSCDEVELSFKGVVMSELCVNVGSVEIYVANLAPVLTSLVDRLSDYALSPSKLSESILEDGEQTFSWSGVVVRHVAASFPSGVRLCVDNVDVQNNNNDDILMQIDKVYAKQGDSSLLWFVKDQDENHDLTVNLGDKILVLVPNSCKFELKPEHISELVAETRPLMIGEFGSNEEPKEVELQTTPFEGVLRAREFDVEVTMLPLSMEGNKLRVGEVTVQIGQDYVEFHNVSFSLDGEDVLIKHGDSTETNAAVDKMLTIDTVKSHLGPTTLAKLSSLGDELMLGQQPRAKPQPRRRVRMETRVDLSILVKKIECTLTTDFGVFELDIGQAETALLDTGKIQTSVYTVHVTRDFSDVDDTVTHVSLVHTANTHMKDRPVVFIDLASDGKPVEIRFWNLAVEYHVRLLRLFENSAGDKPQESTAQKQMGPVKFPVFFVDCVLGLSPLDLPSHALLAVRDANAEFELAPTGRATINSLIRKATLMLIDDTAYLESMGGDTSLRRRSLIDQVSSFKQQGFVAVSTISSVKASINTGLDEDEAKLVVELSSELLTLETCADSTQTLMQVLNGLKPPVEGGDQVKYHTQVMPVNVLEGIEESTFHDPQQFEESESATTDFMEDDVPMNLDFVESYYADKASRSQWAQSSANSSSGGAPEYSRADLLLDQDLSILASNGQEVDYKRAGVFEHRAHSHEAELNFSEDHFAKVQHEPKKKKKIEVPVPVPPVKIYLRDTFVAWNLHDGFDWVHTQDTISKAVKRVEVQAGQAQFERGRELSISDEEDDNNNNQEEDPEPIHEMLFNSIYINIPHNQDPAELRRAINKELNDDASETNSVASSSRSRSTSASPGPSSTSDLKRQKLKLKRSKKHKIRFELRGVQADVLVFAGVNDTDMSATVSGEEGQLLNRVDVRVRDFEIIDNVPTSTWNKFVSYMRSAGDREAGANMLHLIMDTVKPIPDVTTSEVIVNVSLLPLRLHVDQDTLDFMTRFFEFKDERFTSANEEDEMVFIQKFDIRAIRVKLDYKPKKVDYAGLKSGHVTEFMNFFILDEADMVMRRIVLYGVPGFPRLAQSLHDIWMPDIRTTQLGDVLAGIAPVRSLIRLGSGVRDLVAVPVREYRKDGRLVRSLQKGAFTFARTTTNELVKFGAKLAAGTQTFLESAEQAMGGTGAAGRTVVKTRRRPAATSSTQHVSPYSDDLHAFDSESEFEIAERADQLSISDESEIDQDEGDSTKRVSLYANQPDNINQALHVAYTSLGRNFKLARNAVGNIGSQAADHGGNAQDAAAAVARAAPIAIIRPMIGATEAVSKTLQGVTNQMDPKQMANVEDKYKHDD